MADIFLSYGPSDRPTVERLISFLTAERFTIWREATTHAGEGYAKTMERELVAALCVVVVCSRASIRSEWLLRASEYGIANEKLFTVLVEHVDLPLPSRASSSFDLANWSGKSDDPELERLLGALQTKIGPRAVAVGELLELRRRFPSARQVVPVSSSYFDDYYDGPVITRERRVEVRMYAGHRSWLLWTVALIGSLGAIYAFRRPIMEWLSYITLYLGTAVKGAGIAVPGVRRENHQEGDLVDCSVFSPGYASPGASVLIQVFLHEATELPRVRRRARQIDEQAKLSALKTLETEIRHGSRVTITIDAPGLEVDQPSQTITWRGHLQALTYLATFPVDAEQRDYFPVTRVAVDDALVGMVRFKLTCKKTIKRGETLPVGTVAKRYEHAFFSYANEDMSSVLQCAKALQAVRVDYFQDKLSLRPGEYWQAKICDGIKKSDLFLLFWSNAAKQSEWVQLETEYAMLVQAWSSTGLPDIVPIILEGPPPPSPPEQLRDLHFDDRLQYMIAGLRARDASSG